MLYSFSTNTLSFLASFSEPVILVGEGKYNLNILKEITVTESYLGMSRGTCQDEEDLEDCTTRHGSAEWPVF